MFKSKFTHREYGLYLKSELEDIILTPLEEKTASTNLDVLLRNKPEPVVQELNPYHSSYSNPRLPQVIPSLKFSSHCIVPFHTSFGKLWNKLPVPLALQVMSFLSIKSALSFAGTCKALNGLLKHKIYVQKLEKHLNITLASDSNNHLLSDTAFLRSFYKSLYFALAPELVFSTKTMLQEKYSAIPSLARDLIDFSTITNTKTLQIFLRRLWSPVIMLSSTSGRITLWIVFQSYKSSSLHILFDHRPPNSQNIISLRLISADFLVIQTREKTTIPGFAFLDEFVIININRWIEAMDGRQFCNINLSAKEFDHSFQVAYKTNPIGNDFIEKDIDEKFPQYFVCHENEKIPFFYIKESEDKTILSLSNLVLKKIEKPLGRNFQDQLPEIVAPEEGKLLVLSEDLKIKVLTYDQAESVYLTRDLRYSGKIFDSQSSNESFCYQKYQFGSFTDQKGIIIRYLLILKNNEFFFIDTNSLMSRKSLTMIPENGSIIPRWCEKDAYGTVILSRSVTSWHAHKNKIAMALNNTHLVVFEISSQGEFTKISAEKQLLLGQSKWESRSQAPPDFIEKPAKYAQELERSKLPLYMFINNSHLVIVSFPTVSQSFCIYFASLPEILLAKNPEIWTSKMGSSLPALNIQRTKWDISSQDIFSQDPKSFFKDCNKRENYHKLMKFENNKLLLKLGSLNLYFDFECLYNFNPIPFPKRLRQEGPQTLQIDLPNDLRLQKPDEIHPDPVKSVIIEKKKPAANNKHQHKEPELQTQAQEQEFPSRKKKGKKHQHDEDASEEIENEIENSQSHRSQRRKKEFQEFKNTNLWSERKNISSPLCYLHHTVDLKEQFLKLVNKRKEKHKDKRSDSF